MSGFELKLSRVKLELKQEDFGKKLGYSQKAISSMETGRTQVPLSVEQKVRAMLRERSVK